jgi:phosphohistidine phosphatase
MLVCLLRHAEAEATSSTGLDSDRHLTREGLKRMLAVSKGIVSLGITFDEILISSLVRAKETAEPVAQALGHSRPLLVTPNLNPSADPRQVLAELKRLKGNGAALLVGHMPHLGSVFGRLLTGKDHLEVPMKKASLAAFDCGSDPTSGGAELRFYLPARVLEGLG